MIASRQAARFLGGLLLIVLKIIGILLKIIGWLLLIVLAVLLTAMCIPVHLSVKYEPEVTLRIRYLFLKFCLMGEKPPEKPPGFLRRALATVGRLLLTMLNGIGAGISAVFRWIGKGFRWLKGRLRRKPKPKKRKPAPQKKPEDRLALHAAIAGEDAADTAIKYGRICAGAFPALSFLLSQTRGYDPASPRTKDIEIVPDYAGEGITIYFVGEFTLYPIRMVGNLLWAVIKFAVAQIRLTARLNKE